MRGRPKIKITPQMREQVKELAGLGLRKEDIAFIVKVSPRTLNYHFQNELDIGKAVATSQVAKSLFENAMGGNVTAQIFWMKCRASWKDISGLEHSGEVAHKVFTFDPGTD